MTTTSTNYPEPSSQHNNTDLMIWALYLAGGAESWTDVEALFLKAFELAPARLAWRTRDDLPDYKKCAKALQEVEDPKRSRYMGFFEKRGRYQRRLTQQGMQWCQQYENQLSALYGGGLVPSARIQDHGRRVRAIRASGPYQTWAHEGTIGSPIWELAEIFRCLPDSSPAVWNARLDEHLLSAQRNSDTNVSEFIEAVRTLVREIQ